MALELKIITPEENWLLKGIQWNNEEIKAAVAEKLKDYRGLQYTEGSINEAKKDRAQLNKLKDAIEAERKRVKKQCMLPYEAFERQVKEIVALIDEPITLIGNQIKEVEEMKKERKRKDIEELFTGIGFQDFVTLERIFDSKWLNATVSLSSIEEQMKNRMFQIGSEILTINQLPEFSFEAMEVYKNTLDLGQAVREGQRLSDIQKRKAEKEAECRYRLEEEARKAEEAKRAALHKEEVSEVPCKQEVFEEEKTITIDFRVTATAQQFALLKNFLKENNMIYGPVPERGE